LVKALTDQATAAPCPGRLASIDPLGGLILREAAE